MNFNTSRQQETKNKKTNTMKAKSLTAFLSIVAAVSVGCNKPTPSFSILGTSQSFQQTSSTVVQKKVDILWVIDNSASMETSQANLASNFTAFISRLQTLGLDYHMAVVTSEAYLAGSYFNNAYSNYSPTAAQFRDGFTGTYGLGHSGVFVMTPANTTATIFQKNMSEGTSGSGDERAFSSFVQALSDPTNIASGFRRSDAFLSIIILSDEDDFSGNASFCDHFQSSCSNQYVGDHNYNAAAPILQPVSYYTGWLDTFAGGHSNYSVSTMYTDSASCLSTLNAAAPSSSRIIATRYPQIAAQTRGVAGSLCGNFALTLNSISQSVVELASSFALESIANPTTIQVTVNGAIVPNSATNGWTYDAASNTVSFHGTAVPAASATISIVYTPLSAHQ